MKETPILIIPGRGNSEPGHWQSLLESSLSGTRRVQQAWDINDIDTWSQAIDQAVAELQYSERPPLLVAHSFGCLAAAYAQLELGTPVGATLFVAPADPARFGLDRGLFARRLGQPGILVASRSDPWLSYDQAIALAKGWAVDHIDLGNAGHINVASGHGHWPFGKALVETMRADLDAIHANRHFPGYHQPARHPCQPG